VPEKEQPFVTLPNSAAATETPRAAWLVDMAYVVKASRGAFPLDYRNAAHHLRRRVGTLKCHLFNGYDQRFGVPRGLSAFYAAMESEGMDVHLYPMDEDQEGANRQRRVDVAIGAHLVHAAATGTETVILTTGDSDLYPGRRYRHAGSRRDNKPPDLPPRCRSRAPRSEHRALVFRR
jgi:hypothetical protein